MLLSSFRGWIQPRSDIDTDLQLSIKTSPDNYTFGADSWVPLVRPVKPVEKVIPAEAETQTVDPAAAPKSKSNGTLKQDKERKQNGKTNGHDGKVNGH